MAFDEKAFLNKYQTKPTSGGFDVNKFSEKYKTKSKTGFNINNFTSKFTSKNSEDLKSSQGLYNVAVQNGLKDKADNILKQSEGEEVKKIFSGGFISDTFDVLNALQYGTVGLLKGKTFSEGVQTRQSFTDKDALGDNGIPGIIAGTLLDIAFDPLTYIAPETVIKRIPGLSKAIKASKELAFGKKVTKEIQGTDKTFQTQEGGSKLGKYLASKLSYMFGADPVFRETFERSVKNIAVESSNIVDIGKGISNIDEKLASQILKKDKTGRFIRTPINELQSVLNPKDFENVSKLYNKIDNLGKQAVDLGLLSKEKYEENLGEYLKNAYSEYELAKAKGFGFSKIGVSGIKNRVEGLSPEKMKELGQIDNPAYLLFKSAFDLTKDVENAKLLKNVSEKFGTDVAQEGFTQIPKTTKYASLGGKHVPDNIASYIKEIIPPTESSALDKFGKKLVGNFKFFKVVMNPATHARNIVSNKLLNYWKLGMNPLNPKVMKTDMTALAEIAKGDGKWIREAKPLGYNVDTFASAEMKNLLESPEVSAWGKTTGGWDKVKKKLGDIYQGEENHAKLSSYIYQRTVKHLEPAEAWKTAESATFNYAQVTPFVRKLRESIFGFPFITFTVKSTPLVAETALKNPNRISVIGKIKQAIESQADIKETERERASEPSWVKDGFYIKLPVKDKEGRSAYLDLTYILPFGDLMSGNFFERGINKDTGLPESGVNSALNKSPFIQTVGALYKNQDFYGNRIFKESDSTEKQLGDIMRYLTKAYVPPLIGDQLGGGYDDKGERQFRGIRGALKNDVTGTPNRNLMEELLRVVGAKIQPIDADIQETYQEWNKKKGLESLLRDSGIIKDFNTTYIPKK